MVPATPIVIPTLIRVIAQPLPPERSCEVDIAVFRDSKRRNANNQKHVTDNGIATCVLYTYMEKARTKLMSQVYLLLEDTLKIPDSTEDKIKFSRDLMRFTRFSPLLLSNLKKKSPEECASEHNSRAANRRTSRGTR